ncbi:MAG: hypothetical protein ACE5ID_02815 [Acidobacteriota bacterium]
MSDNIDDQDMDLFRKQPVDHPVLVAESGRTVLLPFAPQRRVMKALDGSDAKWTRDENIEKYDCGMALDSRETWFRVWQEGALESSCWA